MFADSIYMMKKKWKHQVVISTKISNVLYGYVSVHVFGDYCVKRIYPINIVQQRSSLGKTSLTSAEINYI